MTSFVGKPFWVVDGKPKTKWQKEGLRYEKKVLKKVRQLFKDSAQILCNQWIKYEGENWCQPDCIVAPHDNMLPVYVLEVKLTEKEDALTKLRDLYCPLVEELSKRSVVGVQVTRSLNGGIDEPFNLLDELYSLREYRVVFCS